jgi:hypothetical protein
MNSLRGVGWSIPTGGPVSAGAEAAHEEKRRAIGSTRLGTGTLACGRCDAPIAIGGGSLSMADELTCPYCDNCGPVRDFLSLASPTRPARVVVAVSLRPRQPVR